jgi:hypothetical protein
VIALALAIPFLFLHVKYQPGVRVPLGSTHLGLELSDLAVIVVALVALRHGVRHGFARLRPSLSLWVASVLLLVWIFARSQSLTHLVTAAKFAEYALLAISLPLILRRREQWETVAAVIVAWSVAATLFALIQIFGVDVADAGNRPSSDIPTSLHCPRSRSQSALRPSCSRAGASAGSASRAGWPG